MSEVEPEAVREVLARARELADRGEIAELHHRYVQGIRDRSTDALVACFTDDGVYEVGHGEPIVGHAAIRSYFDLASEMTAVGPSSFDRKLVSTPFVGNLVTQVNGDTARSEHMVLAVHVALRADGEVVIMRSTVNVDELVRTSLGWKIARRLHRPYWQFETPGRFLGE